MKTTKIIEDEIKDLKIASLPTRPTADVGFGGKGYSATDMKAAFDKLPLFIIERFNSLFEDIFEDGGIAEDIPTGIDAGHTLKELFSDITSGLFATYLTVGGLTLGERLARIEERLLALEGGEK